MLPPLSTPRLALEPAAATDVEPLWELWQDADVRRYLFDDQPVPRERAAGILDDCLAQAPDGLGLWTMRHRAAPEIIGCAGLLRVTTSAKYDPRLAGAIELLVVLAPRVWRRGYARETLRAVLAYGFGALGLAEIAAVNDAPNAASDRLVRRLGFRFAGECDGPHYRMRTYWLTAREFHEAEAGRRLSMRWVDAYPIIVTDKLFECRDFYVRFFGLTVGFEASWFVYLTATDGGRATVAFMHPAHPSAPPGPEPFGGAGMCLEFQTGDAAAAHAELVREGASIRYPLRDEPFGQRRFGLFDPAGVWIDVVEQIEPAAGFWERYPPSR